MLRPFPSSWNREGYHYPLEAARLCWNVDSIFFAFLRWKCFQYVARLMLFYTSALRPPFVPLVPPVGFSPQPIFHVCASPAACRNRNTSPNLLWCWGSPGTFPWHPNVDQVGYFPLSVPMMTARAEECWALSEVLRPLAGSKTRGLLSPLLSLYLFIFIFPLGDWWKDYIQLKL